MYPDLNLFINGQWRKSDKTLSMMNPATGAEIGRLPMASIADLDEALAAAVEETPARATHIVKTFEDVGLLNPVFGDPAEISGHLIPQKPVRLVAFTGSTAVGRQLTILASEHMTSVLMELGGHAPVIVCEDIDVQKNRHHGRDPQISQRRPGFHLPYPLLRA